MDALFQPVANLKGIGTKRAEALEKLGIRTPYDLLYHVPRGYLDYSHPVPVAAAPTGEPCVIRVQIVHKLAPQFIRKGMTIFKAVATDGLNDVTVILYNNPYGFQALHTGSWYRMSGKLQGGLLRREISAPHVLADDSKELIYPSYPLTSGITMPILVRAVKQAIELMRQQPFDWMPEEMRLEHGLLPLTAALEQVHFPANPALMETARRRLA
ncbi:MAG: ATP-dependent DNA helicase RecG, partial [Ruminococcus callidus]